MIKDEDENNKYTWYVEFAGETIDLNMNKEEARFLRNGINKVLQIIKSENIDVWVDNDTNAEMIDASEQ